jgi:hypothetical protein
VARHIDAYERLRDAVLRAQARPEGLAAFAYHGMFGALNLICAEAARACAPLPTPGVAAAAPARFDPALVRLLANMVLIHHQEVSHVI